MSSPEPPPWSDPGAGWAPPAGGSPGTSNDAGFTRYPESSGYDAHPTPPPDDGAPAGATPPPGFIERLKTAYDRAPVTVSIVGFTIAAWLVHLALQHWAGINTDLTLGDNGKGIQGQWWRLITPMVVHFGILHIGLNMLMLWQLGPAVEKVLGRRMFLATYVLCGIAGGIASDLALGPNALSGGASGAIVGVCGVLVGNTFVLHRAEAAGRRSTQAWRFNPRVAKSLAIQLVIWIAFTSVAIPQIDNWAHVGGGVAGLIVGGVLAWQRSEPGPVPPL